jgi:hypothetical protein
MGAGERSVRISVQARHFRCEGDVVVPAAGYRRRVLDLLNADQAFLALTDVLLYRASGGGAAEGAGEDAVPYDVFLLRKGEIEFVVPLDDPW